MRTRFDHGAVPEAGAPLAMWMSSAANFRAPNMAQAGSVVKSAGPQGMKKAE
jgi:hypothetical protein